MAKIIYGVSGEGYGHAIRSKVLIDHLQKKHNVHIVAGGKAHIYLSKYFDSITEVDFLKFQYEDNAIKEVDVFLANLRKFRSLAHSFKKINKLMTSHNTDSVISDFEVLTAYNANFLGIPLISIGNIHLINNCKLSFPKKYYKDYLKAKAIVNLMVPKAKYNFVTTFYYPELKDKKTFLFGPILRGEVIKLKPSSKDFVLVYQTSSSNKKLLKVLPKIQEKFIVYGFGREGRYKNMLFRGFNEGNFLNELKNCKAIITSGGFTLISEGIYLGKPILAIPVKHQFEQVLNAFHLKKMDCGELLEEASERGIKNFLNNLPHYNRIPGNNDFYGNDKICKKIDEVIHSFSD